MQNYRKTSHSTYDCKYHIVWITRYRKRILVGVMMLAVSFCHKSMKNDISAMQSDINDLKGKTGKIVTNVSINSDGNEQVQKLAAKATEIDTDDST